MRGFLWNNDTGYVLWSGNGSFGRRVSNFLVSLDTMTRLGYCSSLQAKIYAQ